MITAHPLLGVGPGIAYFVSLDYQAGFPRQRFEEWATQANVGLEALGTRENLHNGYLKLAAEEGLLGLFLFVLLVGAAAAPAIRQVQGEPLSCGLLFGLLSYGISMQSNHPLILYGQSQLFWFMVAMAAAHVEHVSGSGEFCRKS